jgi:ADP-ribose pyrophosphatase YjhB (NUDIX family)
LLFFKFKKGGGELKEELNITEVKNMHLIGIHGNPGRDPRQHSVEATYTVTTNQNPIAGDDARSVKLYDRNEILNMIKQNKFAFDHGEILSKYIIKIKRCNPCTSQCN